MYPGSETAITKLTLSLNSRQITLTFSTVPILSNINSQTPQERISFVLISNITIGPQ